MWRRFKVIAISPPNPNTLLQMLSCTKLTMNKIFLAIKQNYYHITRENNKSELHDASGLLTQKYLVNKIKCPQHRNIILHVGANCTILLTNLRIINCLSFDFRNDPHKLRI